MTLRDRPRARARRDHRGRARRAAPPADASAVSAHGCAFWPLAARPRARRPDPAPAHQRGRDRALGAADDGRRPTRVEAYDRLLARSASALAGARDPALPQARVQAARRVVALDLRARSSRARASPGTLLELAARRRPLLHARRPAPGRRPLGADLRLTAMNFGAYPMVNGLTRLASRFLGEPGRVDDAAGPHRPGPRRGAADEAGLVTFTPDDIDWDDEVRLAHRGARRASRRTRSRAWRPRCASAGRRRSRRKIFGRLSAWQNWIFQRPNAVGPKGALQVYGSRRSAPSSIEGECDGEQADYHRVERSPTTSTCEDKRLQRALEEWQPKFLDWWQEMGPDGFQTKDVYLRTAISVEREGWAHFGYVKMPDYRWGIFLAEPRGRTATIGFGDHKGAAGLAGSARRVSRHLAPPRSSPRATPSPPRSSSSATSAAPARRSTTCATSSR